MYSRVSAVRKQVSVDSFIFPQALTILTFKSPKISLTCGALLIKDYFPYKTS